jgi:hypothetical protein
MGTAVSGPVAGGVLFSAHVERLVPEMAGNCHFRQEWLTNSHSGYNSPNSELYHNK